MSRSVFGLLRKALVITRSCDTAFNCVRKAEHSLLTFASCFVVQGGDCMTYCG